ncbi:MAG: Glu/Leu/Phe/Val dehydrogenase [Candidatus Magasanikbacteria bacterium]|nr:Glu/Leu/Phe/Val dehydrogenase [Candidatus Magasanikbacteria bacterium]
MLRPLERPELIGIPGFDEHEVVLKIEDGNVGLRGFIALHNTNLGTAVGGTRMYPYASEREALEDVLRLSRVMTYKCAMVGVPHGGGKGVIIGDPATGKTEALLQAYARAVNELHGRFYTGEDVGLAEADVRLMLQHSPYFIGKPGLAGDPSPYAALSTFYAMQTIARLRFGSDDLRGRSVAIKGVGKVGSELARLLVEAGAKVAIADINPLAIKAVTDKFPAVKIVAPAAIHQETADLYAPCALSSEFTPTTMRAVRARVICGAANSQLADDSVGDWFWQESIAYVPDYVANAGGLINVVDELEEGGYQHRRVLERINQVRQTVADIFQLSAKRRESPHRVADLLAEHIFKNLPPTHIIA